MSNQPGDEPFRLAPPKPPRPKPAEFNTNAGRQKVLFSGLDCLPGQMDLFLTDGTADDKVAEPRNP